MKSETAQLKERIGVLEAMVAMAEPPSIDFWPVHVILSWIEEQKKIKRKLDRLAKRMEAANKAKEGEIK